MSWLHQRLFIQKQPIAFDVYMALALYDPEFGYYNTHVDFSARGDFITAPTLTPKFAKALGQFLINTGMQQSLVELGPGNGQLAYDLLLFLEAKKALPQRYYLVERSDFLRQKQEACLQQLPPHLLALVQWVAMDDLQNIEGVVIANEFLDALPVVRFTRDEAGLKELYVALEGDALVEITHEPRPELKAFADKLNLPIGYTSEVCLCYPGLAATLFSAINKGWLLFIDYGYSGQEYYQPMRSEGTLQAYYQHQALNNYLAQPGEMDLTAHVNFTYLSECFIDAGFSYEF